LILLASLAVASAVDLPLRWRWANPPPHGNTVYDMTAKFGLVIQACDRGQLYSSYDLVLWEPLETGTTQSLRGLTFIGNRLIVTGASGTVLYADSLSDIRTALLNPPTTDWLEGVASAGAVSVAVGDNGASYRSAAGINWTRQNSGTTKWLSSVAANPGGLFIAVGETGFISRSSNGTDWEARSSGTTDWLNKVVWLDERFWVMGAGGTVLTSVDGTAWTPVNTGATKALFSGVSNGANRLIVGDGEVRFGSASPLSWVDELGGSYPAPPPNWTYYSAVRSDPYYVIAGRSGMLVQGFNLGTPYNYWETHSDPIRNWLWDMKQLPQLLVAVGDFATVLTSPSGVNWDLELVPKSVTNSIFLGIGGDTNALITVGNAGSIIYSPSFPTEVVLTNSMGKLETNEVDAIGTFWYAVEPRPTANDLQGVAVLNDRYVVTGAAGTILTSDNRGTNWIARSSPTSEFLSGVAAGTDRFVAVGNHGIIVTSPDGVLWSLRDSGTTNWLFRVRFIDDQFMAVGENGTILQSADGVSWTPRTSGTANWLNDVTRLTDTNRTWFAVGNQGTILASTNAVAWTNAGSITSKSLYAATHNGRGALIAAGLEGAILRSQITPFTNEIKIVNYSRSPGQSSFLFAGATGQQFRLDRSQVFSNWVSGEILEFLDGSGTLLYIEPNGPNPSPNEYYRTGDSP